MESNSDFWKLSMLYWGVKKVACQFQAVNIGKPGTTSTDIYSSGWTFSSQRGLKCSWNAHVLLELLLAQATLLGLAP